MQFNSVETLVRWRQPILGDLTPDDFLEAIYDHGLGVELSISMFEAVVR
jgi:EAL domain-containing protein (putative c-di-GMP-specific phosphodiesterase class I)